MNLRHPRIHEITVTRAQRWGAVFDRALGVAVLLFGGFTIGTIACALLLRP